MDATDQVDTTPKLADVQSAATHTFDAMLGMTAAHEEHFQSLAEPEFVSAVVHVTGSWNGVIQLASGKPLAEKAAAEMYFMEIADLTSEEVSDTMGEMVNIIGGIVKGGLAGASCLSVPTVTTGRGFSTRIHKTELTVSTSYQSDAGRFIVLLHTAR